MESTIIREVIVRGTRRYILIWSVIVHQCLDLREASLPRSKKSPTDTKVKGKVPSLHLWKYENGQSGQGKILGEEYDFVCCTTGTVSDCSVSVLCLISRLTLTLWFGPDREKKIQNKDRVNHQKVGAMIKEWSLDHICQREVVELFWTKTFLLMTWDGTPLFSDERVQTLLLFARALRIFYLWYTLSCLFSIRRLSFLSPDFLSNLKEGGGTIMLPQRVNKSPNL